MDLQDATLMILTESAAHPEVARLARFAYDTLAAGGEAPEGPGRGSRDPDWQLVAMAGVVPWAWPPSPNRQSGSAEAP